MASLPPGTIILLGSFLLPLFRGRSLKIASILLPIASLIHLLICHPAGHQVTASLFDYELTPVRADKLSLVWGYVFHIAAILAAIYGLSERNRMHHWCAGAYVGAAIGAVFAGDLLTLFIYWEITAVASVFLIWAGKLPGSLGAGIRYAFLHIGSGVLVLSGALMTLVQTGSLSFGSLDETGMFHDLSHWNARLLLLGFGIKAAFPLVHTWLPDSYTKATPAGTVFLSAFTTKMAIYALARGFAGTDILIGVGVIMCVFPLLYALLADDLRQTLAHVLNNQLGFMVVAIGVGSPSALSGTAAMAFAHVIYKGLLFMAIGELLSQTGTACQSKLGGLAKRMPWTCGFCLIGAFSVFPLNCGFVTKSLVLDAVAEEHLDAVWLVLVLSAAGAFLTAGLKVPYFGFFAGSRPSHDVEEAPMHCLVAMGISASLCLGIGIFPQLLYGMLPHEVHPHPYTLSHIVHQMQLLSGTAVTFAMLLKLGWYPQPVSGTLLDVDWFVRRPWATVAPHLNFERPLAEPLLCTINTLTQKVLHWLRTECSESGQLGRSVSTNAMAISAMILLAIYLLVYY